jgi:nucleoside-diphosphate-sugar epimerase/2-polyprenyl-3-methyl-5-hydroxy-6-metoxy-1,4-benzoquinol methylase
MSIIIGANGFLGSYLSYKIKNSIRVISNDLQTSYFTKLEDDKILYNKFLKLYMNQKYNNSIIYLCADYKNIQKIILDLTEFENKNNIFILFSSAVYYDGINNTIYTEDNKYTSSLNDDEYINFVRNNELYFQKLLGTKIILRLGTLYGSSLVLNASRGVHRMIYFPLINNYLELYDSKIKKSLTSFDDIFTSIQLILKKIKSNFEVFNISSFNTTIEELGNYISNKLSIPIKNLKIGKKNYSFHLDNSKIKDLGWNPTGNINNLIETITSNFNLLKEIKYDNIIIYYTKKRCRVCNSNKLFKILDLKNQPPPNRLNDKFWKLLSFPLILNGCSDCYHLQLNGVLNPIIMYKNYSYLSGTSETMKKYFEYFVDNFIDKNKRNILDIACNDCALLDSFKRYNFKTYGIDPAENIVSNIKDHNIYCGFFNNDAIKYFNLKFEIVTAFNVFAHVDDIYDFLGNIYKITNKDSDIYIQTSQCNMIQNNEFDTIYHEHLSFFSLNSMNLALNKSNFYLHNVHIVDVHGSSYLFHIKQKSLNMNINENILTRYNYEVDTKLYMEKTYNIYSNNIYLWKNNFINLLKLQTKLIGVGASAKGITILNFIYEDLIKNKINIDIIIDQNPMKINKKIDSINIVIEDFPFITNINSELTFILFAWNFKDELIKKIKSIRNQNDKFISLFPLEIN